MASVEDDLRKLARWEAEGLIPPTVRKEATSNLLNSTRSAWSSNAAGQGESKAAGRFAGKVFYITGGTSGLGEQVAKSTAAQGARVCITGRRQERGDKVVAEIAAAGGDAMYFKCDVGVPEQVKASIDAVVAKWGRLDGCFNNAGVAKDADATRPHNVTQEAYDQTMAINVNGVFYSLKYEVEAFLKLKEADPSLTCSIVNCSSIYGFRSTPDYTTYSISKHAVVGLTKGAALAYAADGVRVNGMNPGFSPSEMTAGFHGAETMGAMTVSNWHPSGRWLKNSEVVDGVEWLFSDKSSFYNGQCLILDSGMMGSWTAPKKFNAAFASALEVLLDPEAAAKSTAEFKASNPDEHAKLTAQLAAATVLPGPPTAGNGKRFEGKVVYITGGTSGLGEATAKVAAAEGAKVCITGRREEKGNAVVKAITDAGGEAMYFKCDVAVPEQVKASIDAVVAKWGRLDCCFNNAGVAPAGDGQPPHMVPIEAWDQVIKVNVNGVSYCLKEEVAAMLKLKEADPSLTFSIVNCASIYAVRSTPCYVGYSTSKHAVVGITKSAALAYAANGIRVNNVNPHFSPSEMTAGFFGAELMGRRIIADWFPSGRPLHNSEVVDSVLFLWSDASSYMSGQQLILDHGMTGGWTPPKEWDDSFGYALSLLMDPEKAAAAKAAYDGPGPQ